MGITGQGNPINEAWAPTMKTLLAFLMAVYWLVGGICMAQTTASTPDILAGSAGWVGSGLLGAVLSWLLLVHLPNKDKQDKEVRTAHATLIENMNAAHTNLVAKLNSEHSERVSAIIEQHTKQVADMRMTFKEVMQQVMSQTEKSITSLANSMNRSIDRLSEDMHELIRTINGTGSDKRGSREKGGNT